MCITSIFLPSTIVVLLVSMLTVVLADSSPLKVGFSVVVELETVHVGIYYILRLTMHKDYFSTELLTCKKLYLTNCKRKGTVMFVHHDFLSDIEVDTDADIPATCWLSTWWDCSNIYMWGA